MEIKTLVGKKPFLEFLKIYKRNPDSFIIENIFLKENFSYKLTKELKSLGLDKYIQYLTNEKFDSFYKVNHQGIVIQYREKKTKSIILKNNVYRPPANISIKQMLINFPGIYIITDRIQDPHNLGSIIRSCEALGCMAIFITGKGARINETVQKVATSSLMYLPVIELSSPNTIIEEAKKMNYWIIATTTKDSTKKILLNQIEKLPKDNKYIVLVGSESDGLKNILLEKADFWLEIPLLGHTESLNVSQALSIVIYKLVEYIYK